MTVLRWSIVIMPVGALLASAAVAQTNTSSYVQQPGSIQQMAFQQDDGFALAAGTTALPASPSNLPAAPAASASPPAPNEPPVPPVGGDATASAGSAAAPWAGPSHLWLSPPDKDETPLHSRLCPDDCLIMRYLEANWDVFYGVPQPDETPQARRALPQPWSSPPFPGHEWQGYPLVGVPADEPSGLLWKAMTAGDNGAWFKDNRIVIDGWATASGNWSSAQNSNLPESYWIVPNSFQLDQLCFRFARAEDTVQTDHVDWGFRSLMLYGEDYREMVAGGWGPGYQDYILMNKLYGLDFTEQYFEVYLPPGKGGIFEGTVIRCGRWIACPDIETQYAPDNYLGSHSLLFTYDTYTQTGIMFTVKLNMNWMVQAAITAGTDMAPWYVGATPCGFAGLRWEATDGCNAIYTCLNDFDGAEFRRFIQPGTDAAAGHDNYNYVVSTWEHKFSDLWHTATESYFMWQDNAYLGGTVSVGPYQPYGNNGTNGAPPGSAGALSFCPAGPLLTAY